MITKFDTFNEGYSERFLKSIVKEGEETITITSAEEVADAIKTGKKIFYKNFIIVPNLERTTCQVFRDAPKSTFGFKSVQHFRYGTIERMIMGIEEFINNNKKNDDEKTKYKEDQKAKQQAGKDNINDIIKVGDILYDSWGYDQTNIDFYQVTKILGASVMIRPIKSEIVDNNDGGHSMSAYVKPVKDDFTGDEIMKKVKFTGDNNYYLPSKYGSISKYTKGEKGVYSSWYA